MLGDARPELLDRAGIRFEVCECELLRRVFELKLGVGARGGELQ